MEAMPDIERDEIKGEHGRKSSHGQGGAGRGRARVIGVSIHDISTAQQTRQGSRRSRTFRWSTT